MSDQILTAGRSGVTVTSGAEVDLLSAATTGIPVAHCSRWGLALTTDQTITVRLYKAFGVNAGLRLVASYTVTSAAPLVLEVTAEAAQRVRITGQASSADAAVSCDFAGRA